MNYRKLTLLGIAALILLGGFLAYTAFEPEPRIPPMKDRFSGFIKNVRNSEDGVYVTVDEVEFLSGEEAVAKGMEDTGCGREKIEECIPSLNNGFYIRNADNILAEYRIVPNASVEIFANPGSPELVTVEPGKLLEEFPKASSFMTSFPFHFRAQNGVILGAEEQYLP